MCSCSCQGGVHTLPLLHGASLCVWQACEVVTCKLHQIRTKRHMAAQQHPLPDAQQLKNIKDLLMQFIHDQLIGSIHN